MKIFMHDETKISASDKVKTIGDMIRSFRLSNGFTQKELSIKIGSYVTKTGNNIITGYESNRVLPNISNIDALALALKIDKEVLFRMVLKEHYTRFLRKHSKLYFKTINRKKSDKEYNLVQHNEKEGRYYFCTIGKIKHSLPKFSAIIKKAFNKKGITYKQLIRSLKGKKYTDYTYNRVYLTEIINGKESPSIKMIIILAKYFELNTYEVYNIAMKEKAFAHAKNMMLQWELYKEEVNNAEKNFRI